MSSATATAARPYVMKAQLATALLAVVLGFVLPACQPKVAAKAAGLAANCSASAAAQAASTIGSRIDPAVPRSPPWLVNLQCDWTDLTAYRVEDDQLKPAADYDRDVGDYMKNWVAERIKGTTLSLFEAVYLFDYTSSAYTKVNQNLRNQASQQIADADAVRIKAISSALNKVAVKKNLKVYRGVNMQPAQLGIGNPGDLYVTNQMFSTSIDQNRATDWVSSYKSVVFAIDAVLVSEISRYSHSEWEREVLFPPGSSFKIDSVGPHPTAANITLVKMTQIDRATALAIASKPGVMPTGCDKAACTKADIDDRDKAPVTDTANTDEPSHSRDAADTSPPSKADDVKVGEGGEARRSGAR